MQNQIDPKKYAQFVDGVTSEPSKDFDAFIYRLQELNGENSDIQRLLTAAVGLSAESGEFTEIVKKIIFQGNPYNDDNIYHMKMELGDIMWYLAQACMALNTNFNEILEMNIDKLKSRYPGGEFDAHYSENRKEGDL